MGKGSQAETDGTRADQQPSPKIKVEKVQGKAAPAHPEAIATTQSQGTSDESFLVMIEYDKKPDSPSLFKTRGRHMVSKVLMQACRTFEIEEFYDKARLVLLVDDGEQVYRSVCRRNATMAEAGAEPDARFIVEIDE
ncbi:hypothetical protein NUW54_g3888 [Trametes sanguinea]|nr:hypothetical protein NUW54_g3888 [Trametes sanguinea]